ncbi:MAG: ATP-binding protein [Terracidiphilus sp.]
MTPAQQTQIAMVARQYLNSTGMSPVDFARRVGYAYNSVQQLLSGRYFTGYEPKNITRAVLDFIEQHPAERDAPVAHAIYETHAVQVMREVFARLMKRPMAILNFAPPGCGKTDIARHLIAEHNAQRTDDAPYIFRIYCRSGIRPRDLFRRITTACGTPADSAIERAIHNLRFDFSGKRVVLYFDEAQHLDLHCFETVRELLDEPPYFSLCFAGSDELEQTFDRFWKKGNAERLDRRIIDKVYLPAISAEEAENILRSEVPGQFSDAVIRTQIKAATVAAPYGKKTQSYISIGRLMAAVHEIQESQSPETSDQPCETHMPPNVRTSTSAASVIRSKG